MEAMLLVHLVLVLGIITTYYFSQRHRAGNVRSSPSPQKKAPTERHDVTIEPLPLFDWETTPPTKFRPFKPIYYITMALKASPPSELIVLDTNYPSRIHHRRATIARHPSIVHGCIPSGAAPTAELYAFLLATYLPARYPTVFSLDHRPHHGGDATATTTTTAVVVNAVTRAAHPVTPPADPLLALRILAETVEDDLFLLDRTPAGHRLVAYVCCFPSGFDPSSKLGQVLADIHGPVPSYEKIGAGMERLFARLEVGKSLKRINWTVTTQENLFDPGEPHVQQSLEAAEHDQEVDIEQARVRMELQTLTRLPRTGAILFSFKTYLYPVQEIKEEGLGPQLADAIEGLKAGNAPEMWTYKGASRWGKSVCEYLRS